MGGLSHPVHSFSNWEPDPVCCPSCSVTWLPWVYSQPIPFALDKQKTRQGIFHSTVASHLSHMLILRCSKYGGSLENRARFILEVVDAIKTVMPTNKFVIGVKFNCQDCRLLPLHICGYEPLLKLLY